MIVGVDVSSKRVDLAWLEDGKPCRWHQQLDEKAHLIDRLRSIKIKWPRGRIASNLADDYWDDVTDIAIEYPWARGNGVAALWSTVGVITRQAPRWARVAWPTPGELRAAIGARNTKQDAHMMARRLMAPVPTDLGAWDEHELDALVACLGWTRILQAQDAA